MYVCMYVCMYVYIYIYIYVCVCAYMVTNIIATPQVGIKTRCGKSRHYLGATQRDPTPRSHIFLNIICSD